MADFGVDQRRPRHHLHAAGAGSCDRHARLRAHRRGAFGGVRRLCGEGTGDAHRRRRAETHSFGELRHRAGTHRQVQAAARRGDQPVEGEAAGLHRAAAAAGDLLTGRGPRSRLGRAAKAGDRGEEDRRLRAGRCDRSALHPLHVRHDRHSEGRRARQWRPSGRAEVVDVQPLWREARRGVVVRLRYRLGGRAFLHRLRPADSWRDLDHVRGQAGRHAGRRRVLAGDRRSTVQSRCSRRRPRSARSRRRIRTASCSGNTTCRNSARCFWPASAPIRRRWRGRSSS